MPDAAVAAAAAFLPMFPSTVSFFALRGKAPDDARRSDSLSPQHASSTTDGVIVRQVMIRSTGSRRVTEEEADVIPLRRGLRRCERGQRFCDVMNGRHDRVFPLWHFAIITNEDLSSPFYRAIYIGEAAVDPHVAGFIGVAGIHGPRSARAARRRCTPSEAAVRRDRRRCFAAIWDADVCPRCP